MVEREIGSGLEFQTVPAFPTFLLFANVSLLLSSLRLLTNTFSLRYSINIETEKRKNVFLPQSFYTQTLLLDVSATKLSTMKISIIVCHLE